ncbi:MAG: polysaccharide biosynthesis/export family protein, partial [Longimicrobiales bacterium]
MRTVVTAALLAGLFSLASARASAQTNGVSPSPARPDAVVLRPGDVLRIAVWPNADLGGDFIVEESGLVYLPFLGSIQAAGTSIDDLRIQLRSGYGEAIQNPVVTVSVLFNVGVLGEVGSPGVYQATATTTLIDAIGMAGGFGAAADQEHVRIVRD